MPTEPRITIAEIAEIAHTSQATVSKVLNGRPGVGDSRREQILELLTEHGYTRRGSSRKAVGLLDFAIRDLDTLWATQMIKGAQEEAARSGVGLILTATHDRSVGNRHWINALSTRRTDGLVVVLSRLKDETGTRLHHLRIPYALVDPIGVIPSGAPVIGATNFAGGLAATQHLLGLGHKQIGIIAGLPETLCSQERLDGYQAALTRAGIRHRPELVQYGDFHSESGYKAGAVLLDLPRPPTAIFAGSDLQAHGVYEAARERELRIPEDLSVVGFDDLAVCEWLSPTLTTIRQPLEDMARQATRMVLAMAYQGLAPQNPRMELATTLVKRASTSPPNPAKTSAE
ncbi:MAG: LacI family DNA-binding transcriptional regulator [Bifidobacteriaceae bacterium]|jgi:LacI family transcriptional regulator|nr:LacI family DNA-binding transcriptional regulator [Bifidobacteriaceae bacterium]